ncbi:MULTISPECIES: hypothetical protein [unclassified Kaistella]|uniref:hypothetical protein n=1 Tax=unclassified Kaistella TaxID=2762626 RepID=UPI002732DCFB|nr:MULTISPECIES: hypothetical protein [unclassified Kaistella]MDP2453531.1 hypothetical protein [Kaistella sp. SH11-4b]MDP2456588.1 hypothetical protein [Kaistella sp. SH40-3]MDP2459344.1 hypothetical protein [Kaistella sp. SH19-2b]
MKKIILSALLALAIVISCDKKQESKTELSTTEEIAAEGHSDHDAAEKSDEHDESVKLELNNGAKWAMNAEMKPFINEMESQVKAYDPVNGDFKMLGKNLSETNENLIKSCTIKGTPHDVLHAWLMPHMELIDDLKKAENKEAGNKIVEELKESMEKYHEYFN